MRRAVAREEPGVREQEQPVDTMRRAVAREDPAVWAHESRQRAVARGKIINVMACVAYGMNPVFTVVGTFNFPIQHLGLGRNVALMAAFLLPVTTLTCSKSGTNQLSTSKISWCAPWKWSKLHSWIPHRISSTRRNNWQLSVQSLRTKFFSNEKVCHY